MHLVHRDENYIYNFWPRDGESVALASGRLKSMLYSCPNRELSREMIIQQNYARLSLNDRTMLRAGRRHCSPMTITTKKNTLP